jgi:hypothetical protein
MRKRPNPAQLQAQCDAWNAKHPVGTLVSFENIKGEGETHRGKSSSEAQVMSGHSAVIWLENKSGCVHLDHCTAVAEEVTPEQTGEVSVLLESLHPDARPLYLLWQKVLCGGADWIELVKAMDIATAAGGPAAELAERLRSPAASLKTYDVPAGQFKAPNWQASQAEGTPLVVVTNLDGASGGESNG